ncbi:transcriptional regulator [Pantoea agglomerans]|uniref:transcriptional antitermination N peptide n=1 Tax=Enterobacter agglomerans TaxID=549 RepID=UPI0013BE6BA0|nr:transcriptional regulator [Pantoea agglomerans]NEG85065.1 transcriptional regulator [Pantoea agglomerans]NEH07012.1 transcriptional regulator [Pantoea agglomerans]WVL84895.1 transcriptional regulator [Pantoea agglomerans]
MNNKQRKKLQRAVEHRAMKLQQQGFERRIVSTLSSCNQRVEKAVISPSLRDRHESTSVCLPEIAIFNAGYRTVRKDVTHIIK